MNFTRFDIAQLQATPWRNAGGATREIVCQPPGAGTGHFDWRVSVATIAKAGPFSVFPGVDRVIMLLDGDGVHLHNDAGLDHWLDKPLVPFAFSGDMAVECDLLSGTSIDFNVMVRRDSCRAEVQVLREACDTAIASDGVVLAWGGAWHLQGGGESFVCSAGSGGWWQGVPQGWRATPQSPGAALVLVRLAPVDG